MSTLAIMATSLLLAVGLAFCVSSLSAVHSTDEPSDSFDPISRPSHLESVAKHMSQWLRSVATEELGVTHMQQIYDSLSIVNHNVRYDVIVSDISHKVSDQTAIHGMPF